MKTLQETFDEVCSKLIKQGKRSFKGHQCMYRDGEGNKCAVGHLIPDDQYRATIEDYSLLHVITAIPALREHNYELLMDLQADHDHAEKDWFMRDFIRFAKATAVKFGLNTEVLKV